MNKAVIHFQNDDVMQPQPWPVGVDDNMVVTSGLGTDDGAVLIGFGPKGEQRITVMADEAMAAPGLVVGLVPTFSNNGSFFEWAYEVSGMSVMSDVVDAGAQGV